MSSFSGLNTAASGLLAHKRSIDVIGQNIANVNTPGYTRRSVILEAANSHQIASRYDTDFNWNNLGVDVAGVNRIRDAFLDTRARNEAQKSAGADRLAGILGSIEGVFPEPSDTAVGAQLASFWNAFSEAANNPTSLPARTAVLTQASSLVSTFQKASADLTAQHTELTTQLSLSVGQVNDLSRRIAELNAQVRSGNVAGMDTGDLEDRRDVLVDQLTSLVGATTRVGENRQVDVMLGGSPLVTGSKSADIEVVSGGPLPAPLDTLPMQQLRLQWKSDGYPVGAFGGDIGGQLQGINDVVPRYLQQLNSIASNVVTATNAVHRTGQGLNALTDVNLDFFDPTGLTAATLSISSAVDGQPSRLALGAVGSGGLDGTVGHALGALIDSTTGPDALYRSMIGQLGVESSAAQGRAELQQKFSQTAENDRQSVSGVNLDEEMTNMVMSQRAYEASARLLTTVDEMLDTLINRTGLVGR